MLRGDEFATAGALNAHQSRVGCLRESSIFKHTTHLPPEPELPRVSLTEYMRAYDIL